MPCWATAGAARWMWPRPTAGLATAGADPLDFLEVVGRRPPDRQTGSAVHRRADHGGNRLRGDPQRGAVRAAASRPACAARCCCPSWPSSTLICWSACPARTDRVASGMDALSAADRAVCCPDAPTPSPTRWPGTAFRRVRPIAAPRGVGGQWWTRGVRDDLALASLFGGLCLANSGLGAVHGLAAAIGGPALRPARCGLCRGASAAAMERQPAGAAGPGCRSSRPATDRRGGRAADRPVGRDRRGRASAGCTR